MFFGSRNQIDLKVSYKAIVKTTLIPNPVPTFQRSYKSERLVSEENIKDFFSTFEFLTASDPKRNLKLNEIFLININIVGSFNGEAINESFVNRPAVYDFLEQKNLISASERKEIEELSSSGSKSFNR